MRREELFLVLGELSDDLVEAAKPGKAAKAVRWRAWGAAACLCLVLGAAAGALRTQMPVSGGGGAPGGTWPEGVDPIVASVAVFPAERDLREVADAVCESIGEDGAYHLAGLGEHLPDTLPEGLTFRGGELYTTTMEDGTVYHLLRVHYTDGTVLPSSITDGETGEPVPDALRDVLSVFVMDYRPQTKKPIHQQTDLPAFLEQDWEGGTFHFTCGEAYVGVTPNGISAEALLAVTAAIS